MKSQLDNSEGKCIVTQEAGEEPRRRTFAWHAAGWIFMLALTVSVRKEPRLSISRSSSQKLVSSRMPMVPFSHLTRKSAGVWAGLCATLLTGQSVPTGSLST